MHKNEQWIEEASVRLSLTIYRVPAPQAAIIQRNARSRYLDREASVWSLSLATKPKWHDARATALRDVLPSRTQGCWLLPETDSYPLPVFEASISSMCQLLSAAPPFEYNLLATDYSWLLVGNDEDDFYFCSDDPTDAAKGGAAKSQAAGNPRMVIPSASEKSPREEESPSVDFRACS